MLENALRLCLNGQDVYTVYHTQRMADYAINLFMRLCAKQNIVDRERSNRFVRIKGARVHFISIQRGDVHLLPLDRVILEGTPARIEGVSIDTPVLVDHAVYEQ